MDKCIKRKTSNEKYLFIYDGVKFHQYCDFILKYYSHAKDKIITYVSSVLYMLKMFENIILQKKDAKTAGLIIYQLSLNLSFYQF